LFKVSFIRTAETIQCKGAETFTIAGNPFLFTETGALAITLIFALDR
jgi:hypothetical protein